jgi:maleate isomerase
MRHVFYTVKPVSPNFVATVLNEAHAALPKTIHVGVLVPWANEVVETELPRLGLDRVVFHYARLVPASRTTALDHLFIQDLTAVVPTCLDEVSRLPLATTLLACTSAGFMHREAATPPVVSAFDALVSTLNLMSINRIALITPYPYWLTEIEVRGFIERGIAVGAQSSLNRTDGYAQVSPTEIRNLISQTDLSGAQAIVMSCTGWPTLSLLTELEDTCGKAVLSSNLAMAIHAMTTNEIGTGA